MAEVNVTVTPTANANVTVSSTISASGVSFDSATSDLSVTDLQTAVSSLANEKFAQTGTPTTGVTEGDIWYDTDDDKLMVYKDSSWVETQEVLGQLDGGGW
jgi:hypothetical protein